MGKEKWTKNFKLGCFQKPRTNSDDGDGGNDGNNPGGTGGSGGGSGNIAGGGGGGGDNYDGENPQVGGGDNNDGEKPQLGGGDDDNDGGYHCYVESPETSGTSNNGGGEHTITVTGGSISDSISGTTITVDLIGGADVGSISTGSDVNVGSISTASDVNVGGISTASDVNVASISTASDVNVGSISTASDVNVASIATASDVNDARVSDASNGGRKSTSSQRSQPPWRSPRNFMPFTRNVSSNSSENLCTVCQQPVIPGCGRAIFTAECSHCFHMKCVSVQFNQGRGRCPVCNARWEQVPVVASQPAGFVPQFNRFAVSGNTDNSWRTNTNLHQCPYGRTTFPYEPVNFNDDDCVVGQQPVDRSNISEDTSRVVVSIIPEVSAIPNSGSSDDFSVLVRLKAPAAGSNNSRAAVDLVTVLDVSGSMAGTKLALLKRAMGFVIQHLGPDDRLSVVAFSSKAHRLFPLSKMNNSGRQLALQNVNSLSSNGGTNIAEGLKKGAKVMLDRKYSNPVSSIILLSDGQDTYTITGANGQSQTYYMSLLPSSIQQSSGTNSHIPVHTFGFGADHDAALMHSISEASAGTFSFIEAEDAIQDAFAQCMGGLLSVVVQDLKVSVNCLYPSLRIKSIKAGSYEVQLKDHRRTGVINVQHMYAEEERNFLVIMNIPPAPAAVMPLLNVSCSYTDIITNTSITSDNVPVNINRPERTDKEQPDKEVDKYRNMLRAADAMSEAKAAAELGDLDGAISILERCRQMLSESSSMRDGDDLGVSLYNDLKQMQERMVNRQVYETTGRAYVLSGISSHSWQRATARGDAAGRTDLSTLYRTTVMADMITRSQTMALTGSEFPHPSMPPRTLTDPPCPR